MSPAAGPGLLGLGAAWDIDGGLGSQLLLTNVDSFLLGLR